jgi:hypothetical protein
MAQAPQLNDSQLNLLAKIAANTGETQPKHGDGQHNLLYKIAQNTYASAVNSSNLNTSDISSASVYFDIFDSHPSINGFYDVWDIPNGKFRWANSSASPEGASWSSLRWNDSTSRWELGTYTAFTTWNALYFNTSNLEIPPASGWQAVEGVTYSVPTLVWYSQKADVEITSLHAEDSRLQQDINNLNSASTASIQALTDDKLDIATDSYVVVRTGDNLATKYSEAKVLTPNGNARSATNRVTLFIVPGAYSLSSELAIDTEFVDIVGLGAQFQSPAVIVTNNTLNVTANNVRASGISVGTQQFKIGNNKPLQRFENCVGGNQSFTSSVTTSGTFLNCVAGSDSFGGSASGTSSGTFKNCIGGNDCFGATASGVFENCAGGGGCFGLGTASGIFKNCSGGIDSFGGGGSVISGEIISCRLVGAGLSYVTPSGSGIIRFCLDGDNNIVNADAP